jgi:hypothetical protein
MRGRASTSRAEDVPDGISAQDHAAGLVSSTNLAAHLLTGTDIIAKYRSLTRSVIDTSRQHAIAKAVLNLEALSDINALTDLLTPACLR